MAKDDILDDLEWENDDEMYDEGYPEFELAPDREAVRIKRFLFAWQAEFAKLALQRERIPCFITNVLTNNLFMVDWARVELYVRKEEVEQALEVLATLDLEE